MEKDKPSKSLPEITKRKPRLRNKSWAKLLSQRKTGNEKENIGKGNELDDPGESIFLKGKQTIKTEPIKNMDNKEQGSHKENRKKISCRNGLERLFTTDKDSKEYSVKQSSYVNVIRSSQAKCKECTRRICDYSIASRKHLPPLVAKPEIAKITPGKFPKLQSFPSEKRTFIDWQTIFRNGGFRPCESRDVPTRGEVTLLKHRTWNDNDQLCCLHKCAKYFDLYFGRDTEVEHAQLPIVDKERQSRPLPSYRFSPVSDRRRESLSGSSDLIKFSRENADQTSTNETF